MSGLLPQKTAVEPPAREPEIVGIEDVDSDAVFAALSSETARSILRRLYRQPATQSELAEEFGTSIQNVDYHLEKLVGADLVTIADSWYSEKGKKMNVYAPAGDPLVVIAGDRDEVSDARAAVTGGPAGETVPDAGE